VRDVATSHIGSYMVWKYASRSRFDGVTALPSRCHTQPDFSIGQRAGMTTVLLVGVGGFLGANVRFGISAWARRRHGARFPVGTLIANLSGSFLIGLVLGVIHDRDLRLLLASGFLGAETTFSTFAVESVMLEDRASGRRAAVNVAANTLGSLTAAAVGLILAELLT
jgi:CrcB protein